MNKNPPDGIEFIDNEENSVSEVHAVITGPEGTPFVNGKFRMKLLLGNEYPAAPPRGFFLTKIYHPNVASNGDICVNTLKKDWSPDTTLKHVLQVIRCLLIVPFPESSLNDEAGKLFMDSYDEFARRAVLMTSVHAIDETEENDDENDENDGVCKVSADGTLGSASDGASALSTSESTASSKESGSSKSTVSEKISKKSSKDKDAKKKSLKRL